MVTSDNLLFSFISTGQSQKEVTANGAFATIDAILNTSIIDKDLTTPPGSPSSGDLYIPAATATGDWAAQEGKIAWYNVNAWEFIIPNEGMSMWVADENIVYYYDGAAWSASPGAIQNIPLLGINTTADATNKLAVNSSAILFNNVGNGVQAKINKAAAGDTNSLLFQTGFSGRAEMGCAGDDDFHFKVSPDGFSTTYEAITIDKDNGAVTFPQALTFGPPDLLTISSGEVTLPGATSNISIDTEGAASADNLDFINGGIEEQLLLIRPTDDTHTVNVLESANMQLLSNMGMDNQYDRLWLQYVGGVWIELSRTNNGT